MTGTRNNLSNTTVASHSSELKDEKEDPTPLYSLLPPEKLYLSTSNNDIDEKIFEKAFNNIVIEKLSLDLLRRGSEDQRYAVVGIIRKVKMEEPYLELFFRPGFESSELPEKLDAIAREFQNADGRTEASQDAYSIPDNRKKNRNYRQYFVQAIKGKPGVVHAKIISKIINKHRELEDKNKPWHIDESKAFTLGFSVYKRSDILEWTNRSTKNRKIFSKNALALACLAYSKEPLNPNDPDSLNLLNRNEYDHYFNLDRSIQFKTFKKITGIITLLINKKINTNFIAQTDENLCWSAQSETAWKKIGKLSYAEKQAKIQQLLINNIFIFLLGYGAKKHRNQSEQLLIDGFEEATKQNIIIDLEYIPYGFRKNIVAFAAEKGNINLIKSFLQQVKTELKHKYWQEALQNAVSYDQFDLVKYLFLNHQSFKQLADSKNETYEKNTLRFLETFEQDSGDILPYLKNEIDLGPYRQLMFELVLLEAAKRGQIDRVRYFADKIDERLRQSAIKIAIEQDQIEIFELLLNQQLNTPTTDQHLGSALFTSVQYGTPRIIRSLLNAGVNIESKDSDGNTPLVKAIKLNKPKIVEFLLENKANFETVNGNEETPLIIASNLGNLEIISLLLKHKAYVEAEDYLLQTSLYKAVNNKDEEAALLLMQNNASLFAEDVNGLTPLDIAFKKNLFKVLQKLTEKIVNTTNFADNEKALQVLQNHPGVSCAKFLNSIFNQFIENKYFDLLESLVAEPNLRDKIFDSLSLPVTLNSIKIFINKKLFLTDKIKLLIIRSVNENGDSLLTLAANTGDLAAAKLLLEYKIDTSHTNQSDMSALMIAISRNNVEMINFLIESDKDLLAQKTHQGSCFHVAAKSQQNWIIEKYINDFPQLINEKDHNQKTILDIAVETGNIALVNYLLAKDAKLGSLSNEYFDILKPFMENPTFRDKIFNALPSSFDLNIIKNIIDKKIFSPDQIQSLVTKTVTERGNSFLHKAAYEKNLFTVELLLEYKVDIRQQNLLGESALMHAILSHDQVMIEYFISKDINLLSQTNYTGENCFHLAAKEQQNWIIEKYLKELPQLINAKDSSGRTMLDLAVETGNKSLVAYLLTLNAQFGFFPFENVAYTQEWDFFRLMVRHGGNLAEEDENNDCAIDYIIYKYGDNYLSYCADLLRTPPDHGDHSEFFEARKHLMTRKFGEDKTLLHFAAEQKNHELFLEFVQWGASLYEKDDYQKTPIDYAKEFLPTDKWISLKKILNIVEPVAKITPEFIEKLVLLNIKDFKDDLPENINYEELKEAFLTYAKNLKPDQLLIVMERIKKAENKLGIILRDEPKPPISLLSPPSTLQKIVIEVENLLNVTHTRVNSIERHH